MVRRMESEGCKGEGMTPTRREVDALMKRCQIGVGGRNALDNAHSIMADCYGTLGALMLRVEELELWRDRYETLRKLNPRAFGELYALNLSGEKPFDQLVDELRAAQTVDR